MFSRLGKQVFLIVSLTKRSSTVNNVLYVISLRLEKSYVFFDNACAKIDVSIRPNTISSMRAKCSSGYIQQGDNIIKSSMGTAWPISKAVIPKSEKLSGSLVITAPGILRR